MAVTFRSKSPVFNTNGTSPTATEPAGAASGDALLALYATASGASPTLPAGWTTLYGPTTQGGVVFRVGYLIRGGSAPSYAFTHTGSVYRELHVLCFQGAAAITLDSQSSAGATGSTVSHNPDPPATTAVASSSLAVAGGINWGGSVSGWSGGAGYTVRSDNTAGNDCVIVDKSLAAPGSENPAAFSGAISGGGAQDWWDGFTVTFTDAGGGAAFLAAKNKPILQAVTRASYW
jgi:hypothetical protein